MKKFLILFVGLAILGGCKKEDPQLGDPPTAEDAKFTYTTASESDNIIIFTASNDKVIAKWDFGNDTKGEGVTVRGIYPTAGTYVVTLTVFTSGGSLSSSQEIVIENDDLSLLDNPIYNALTGGVSVGTKTWVIDSVTDGHMGVGPNPSSAAGDTPEWWAAAGCDKKNTGLYNDKYVFKLDAFKFDMITNGDVYVQSAQEANFPGAYQNSGDYTAPYADRLDETWSVTEEDGINYLNVTGESFLGFYTGTNKYQIISISDDKISLRYLDASDGGLAWYLLLVPDGTITGDCGGGGGNPNPIDTTGRYSLPIDFEAMDVNFEAFGGSSDTTVDNPDTTGINKSSRVLETVHGHETWAGVFVDLKTKIDLGTQTKISVKVWAPNSGTLRIKLEDSQNSGTFVEKDVSVNSALSWEEVSIDFAGSPSNTYDRLVLFPGWGVANAGTFYLDDIKQQ